MFRCNGYDIRGIRRVWGQGATFEEAYQECRAACEEYVKRRPDCWPMTIKQEDATVMSDPA